jgi:hypothetical protein
MDWLPIIGVAIASVVCLGAGMFVALRFFDAPTTDGSTGQPPNGSGRF